MDDVERAERGYGPLCDAPVERAAVTNRWLELTFLHWRYDEAVVQRLLPAGLEVERFDGSAWVSLVPFTLHVGALGVASVPWATRFPETNVRTYVRSADGRNGVWFLSLDAARLAAVLVARATYHLPYHWAEMSVRTAGSRIEYRSRRRWPGPRGARCDVTVDVGAPIAEGDASELDHFLTARWALYSAPRRGVRRAPAEHDPWPLQRATLVDLHDDLLAAGGLPRPTGDPLVHFAASTDVRIGWPAPVGAAAAAAPR